VRDSRFVTSQGGLRLYPAFTAAAVLLCVLAGPFGTSALPLATRTLVWTVLIVLNAAKWWAWYHWLGPRMPTGRWGGVMLAVGGALLLNATLPLEIRFVYRAVGLGFELPFLELWLVAVAISATISALVALAIGARAEDVPAGGAPQTVARGLALKTDLSRLLAVTAEDHYLRLHLERGAKPMLLYRFGDALADLAAEDGEQVHRGAWIAARGVAGAERQGRRWWLRLPDGTRLPVSDRHLPAVRARGWLKP
jgi:hypothetical protein